MSTGKRACKASREFAAEIDLHAGGDFARQIGGGVVWRGFRLLDLYQLRDIGAGRIVAVTTSPGLAANSLTISAGGTPRGAVRLALATAATSLHCQPLVGRGHRRSGVPA